MRSSLLNHILFIACMLPFSAARAERNYGAAGCGVGSLVVKKKFAASCRGLLEKSQETKVSLARVGTTS